MKELWMLMTTGLPLLLAAPITAMAADAPGRFAVHGGRGVAGIALLAVVVLAVKMGWLALSMLGATLRPAGCRRGAEITEKHFGRSFLIGLLVLVAYIILLILLSLIPEPPRGLLILPLLVLFAGHCLAGFTAMATALGERVEANLGWSGGSTVRAVLLGGGILVLAGFFPILGQLLDFVVLAAGLGVVVQVLVARKG